MSTISPDEVFSLLGVKDAINDPRYFVGREELLSNLSCCVVGEQRSPAWLCGPRRIGKSSVAKAIARKGHLNNTLVLWIDAIDITSAGIETVFHRAIDNARQHIVINGSSIKDQFESLATSSASRPVLVILDEFDSVALTMRTEEQAFLRRLNSQYELFSCLFITCLKPTLLVEEVPEIRSRILGICNQQKVMPLERRNIKQLCNLVAQDIDLPKFTRFSEDVWQAVGGFPVAVTSLVKALAVANHFRKQIANEDIEEVIETARSDVEIDLLYYWRSLNPGTRLVLLKQTEPKEYEKDLKEDGFISRRNGIIFPRFLIEINQKLGIENPVLGKNIKSSSTLEKAAYLFQLCAEINEGLKLRRFKDAFRISHQHLHFGKVARPVHDEEDFNDTISYLYKVFYEGARTQKGEKLYRLPKPLDDLYKSSRIIGNISNLRNFLFHDKTRDTDSGKSNNDYGEAAKIFKHYCGKEIPASGFYRNKIRDGLTNDLIELLENILDYINSDQQLEANG